MTDNPVPDHPKSWSDEITEFSVLGYDDSVVPEDYPIRVVGIDADDTLMSETHLYPFYGNWYSGYLDAGGTGVPAPGLQWDAVADSWQELGSINDCLTPTCRWQDIYIEIFDPTRARNGLCDDYLGSDAQSDPNVKWCPTFSPVAYRKTSGHANCAAGSGRFRLVPVSSVDRDQDGRRSFLFQPVMTEGQGALTADATVTWIRRVSQNQTRLSALGGPAREFHFSHDDSIWTPFPGPLPVDALGTQPSTEGFVPGSPFLVERLERGSLLDEEVEMTWTCDGEVAVDQLDLAQGYSFSLAELGCAIDWPQRLTVRPSGTDLRRLVTVELYGIPSTAVTVPLRDSFDGEQFKFAQRGLVVEGALLGAGDALTVRLDGVKFAGLPICPSRSHRFLPEF